MVPPPLLVLLLFLPPLSPITQQKDIEQRSYIVSKSGCTHCKVGPPVSKCTNCEAPRTAKRNIDGNCDLTLTCAPGRILIANNRYVVSRVECSDHSTENAPTWIGTDSDNVTIVVENAACFITPIACIALGSFSTRCPRGFVCEPIKIYKHFTEITCSTVRWWHRWRVFGEVAGLTYGDFYNWITLNIHKRSLWYQDRFNKWVEVGEDIKCDQKIGAWIETRPPAVQAVLNAGRQGKEWEARKPQPSILTDRIICGAKESSFFGMLIEYDLMQMLVLALHVCLSIIFLALCGIPRQLRRRESLKETIEYLKDKKAEGEQKEEALKELEALTVKGLIDRWKVVNEFVVKKYKPVAEKYVKNRRRK